MSNIRRLGVLVAIALLVVGIGGIAQALKAPHDTARLGGGCNLCHVRRSGPNTGFSQMSSFEAFCFNGQNGCHNTTDTRDGKAPKKTINKNMASNRFKNIVRNSGYAAYSTNKKQSSHGWKIPNTNSEAGATNDWRPMTEASNLVQFTTKIGCTRCHRAHGDFGPNSQTIYRSFLKADPKGDNICFQCHAARRIDNVRASLPAGKHYSHPVEVNYSSASAAKPGYFEPTPTLTAGYNASARPRLYTTIGGVKGAVVCSTCHGPLHAADSNPYTYDNLTSYYMRPYSSSAGNLLRQYPMSKAGHENKLCKSCHKVSLHKAFNKCSDCHEPHKKSGDKNLFLIKTSIMTPYGKRSVKFESTSTMASRWGIYSGSTPTDKSQRSKGICQVCHRYTGNHRAYSSAGSKRDHNYLGGASNRFKFCPDCHKHVNTNSTGAFLPEGCNGCHADPPTIGKHSKHVGDSNGYISWKWETGVMSDQRSASSYGFSCGRCHTPWTPYTATAGGGKYEGKNHYGLTNPDTVKVYTTEIGFKNVTPLPANPSSASYTYGGAGTVDRPYSVNFRTPSTGTCANLYCHGQFYGGYTSNNPNFNDAATQSCVGSCHGTNAAKLPGVNGTGEWGAHRRHVGSVGQQYGSGTPNFRCNACHYATAVQNRETTISSRIYHVNGKTNVRFDPSYGYSASTYKALNDYSSATNTTLGSKTQYYTCASIYCHSDGSRTNSATQGGYSSAASYSTRAMAFPSWSSLKNFTTTTGGIKRCTKCHGNDQYRGITSAMPEYATRPGKGNAHQVHIISNRVLCYACHSNTVGSDNRTISTAYHVNKTYDVNMASAYGGTWDNTAKRCSGVKCHGQKLSPAWNEAARCQDCHFTSTGVAASNYTSEKKGYNDNYRFRNFTIQNSMPRIYSSEWRAKGHGSTLANKVCDDCHSSTFRHLTANVANNPYRLDNSDTVALCQQGGCHPTYKSHTKADMDNYGNATWAFNPKCVDCHDPHSDSNRKMVKRYINFTTGSDAYGRVANPYANNVRQVTFTTVGSNTLLTWSSFVKADYSGICQRCHNTQAEVKYFRKYSTATGDGFTPSHNAGSKCTECHLHTAGFKPKACNGCHFFPPKEAGSGDPNGVGTRMKHNRHVNWTSPYVDRSYDNLVNIPSTASYNFACKKCHAGTHASDATNPRQVDVGFDATAYPKNPSAVYARFNGWTETGAEADNYDYMYSSGRCSKVYCHGKFFGGYTENAARFDNTSAISGANWSRKQICGACHGASQAKPPTGGAHTKHAGTYSFGCRNCHRDTNGLSNYSVTNKIYHADGKTRWRLYTTEDRIGGDAKYSGSVFGQITTETSSPTYSLCSDTYCHSNGTSSSRPFPAYGNYTAKWGLTASAITGAGKGCSLCHGNKGGSGYAGITSAMPNYNSGSPKINSHRKHVVDNGFSCYACHTNTVDSTGRAISSSGVSTYHVNMTYDVSFPAAYSGVYNGDKTCSRVKCHGRRMTPAWGGSVVCTNCHFQGQGAGDGDVMDFSFRNYSNQNSVPKIYSAEWKASGHGKTGANYNRTNNPPAGKSCNACHVSSVKHNTGSNFFRLTGLGGTSDPSTLCKRCHGRSTERDAAWMGNRTGIQGHTQQILSSEGYANLTTWRFKPKCTDCHDPHGDSNSATSGNIAMIRNTVLYNLSGSDSSGRPIRFGSLSTVFFEKYTGTRAFDDNTSKGRVCAVCHKRTAHNGNGSGHANEKLDCRSCHKHKQGFTPAGCTGCHGDDTKQLGRASWAPPKGPTTPLWSDSMTNRSSLHLPHSYNPKGRPGFANQTGFACEYCHDDSVPAASGHNTAKVRANMNNLTSTAGWSGRSKQSKIGFGVEKAPADNTCWNTSCHTPRAYIRTWQKPKDCDDCHGYTRGKGAANRAFNLQTSQSHKIHINWTGVATPPASWKKNYKFACSNCHYDPANNYSTHYSGLVNITSAGTVNTVGGQFYTRGRSFEGFTTGNESLGTCSKTYCHGNFANGTAITKPNWKKGVTTVNCGSCHRAKTAKVAGWSDGTLMPAPHPTHVNSATYNFSCARCHNWTVNNNTTVQFTYSTHVNTRKDVNFDNTSGTFTNSSKRMCQNNYCHSSGATVVPRTVSNYTADWLDGAAVNKTGAGKGCSYCHGSKGNGFGGITAAMPNYANQAHAKHARNATGDSFRCNVCHAATVNAAGQIISNINHVNKFKNISIIASYKSGQTAYSTTVGAKKTCKNIRCHGGLTTPLWTLSTGINCLDCHKSSAGDTDKRISSNNTFQGYSETVPKIYSTQWAQRGHGRPTASGNYPVSNNSAANKTCTACHGAGETRANGLLTRHGNTAANPFRLLTAPNRPNVLCESCHGTNASNPGKGTMVGIQTHASSVTGGGGNGFSFWIKCIDCHDPHGDNNVQMLHSTIARPSAALTKKESSNQFGALFFNATGRNVDFVNNVYTSDYAKKVTSPKVCQVCHSQTFKPNSSAQRTRFRWNGSSETAHGTGKCTSCHGHNQGFKGVKCDACHGNPPTSKFNMLTSTTNGEKWPFSGTTSAGAHNRHVSLFGSDSNTCAFCHQQGMYNSGSSNDNIDIGFKAFGIYTGKYTGKSGVRNGWYGYSGVGITTGNTARCEVQCHGQKGWLTASYGTPTAPLWENNKRTATCGKCHGAKKVATSGSWPATAAHALHAGTGGTQLKYMCKLCHDNTVQGTATSLSSSYHVNSVANVAFGTAADPRADTNSSYLDSNTQVNSAVNGKCTNTYCHSKGTDSDKVAPYTNAADFANWTATWSDSRTGYRKASANSIARCNYCHGNKNYTGILASMPNYNDLSPKSNKHQKHVRTYNFVCTSCHLSVTVNNTSIDGGTPGNHVNSAYNVNFNSNTRSIDNSLGRYTSVGSWCRNTYCHSKGTDRVAPFDQTVDFASYTAKWGSDMITGGYKTGMRCKYCHGSKTGFAGMTAAMPNYANTSPKANRHQKHVVTYGFTCTRCHVNVTVNNTSIDASGGASLHLNEKYNVNFNNNGTIDNTLGTYTLQTATPFSKCKNTYCHSRGTDFTSPYGTRTSFANFTARWGDTVGGYKQAAGLKAKCNYCHGNRLFAGMTSAMPNYSTAKSKNNSHNRHVARYGFTCDACHERVTTNNTSIAPSGRSLHANKGYNVDFNKDVAGRAYINNTGSYTYIDLANKSRCKNTYCHSRGADLAKPFNTRTSFSVFTAMWGDDLSGLGYKKPAGQKAKCNYCHGDKRFSGTTSAMPNYSGNVGAVKAKANSHRAHVIGQGIVCSTCHNNIVRNNTSISDRTRHVNGFYNISIEPAKRGAAGLKVYSMAYNGGGGTCMNNTCHGNDKPKWGDSSTVSCRGCHFATSGTEDNYAQNDQIAAKVYSTEYMSTGHGRTSRYPYSNRPNAGNKVNCTNCHKTAVAHNNPSNPFRLMTSDPDAFCKGCHGTSTERSASSWTIANVSSIDYKSHSKQGLIDGGFSGADGGWNFPTGNNGNAKCVDCHDPHGDKNRKMLHALINYSGSNSYGQPGTYTPTGTQQRYTAYGAQIGWSSFVSAANKTEGICQRCHTPQATMENFNKSTYETAHKAHQKCTGCHDHKVSFAPAESSGNQSCTNCHANLFNPMNSSTRSYHHVMQNTSATGASKYPAGNNYTTVAEARRRCLQCHVDHDIFRPDLNPGNKGRAGNLRASIDIQPVAGTPSTYDRSDYSRTAQDGGICMSCHKRAQRKSNKQVDDPSVYTLKLFTSLYGTSPHNYNVTSFQIKNDSSNFKANCLKCHNDTMEKTMYNNSTGFGLHDSALRRLNAKLGLAIYEGRATVQGSISTIVDSNSTWTLSQFNGRGVSYNNGTTVVIRTVKRTLVTPTKRIVVTPNLKAASRNLTYFTVGDPPEEDFCFNCHSLSDNPNANGGNNAKDFFGVVDFVNSKATKMEQTFKGDYGKPRGTNTVNTLKAAASPSVAWENGTTIGNKFTGWAGYYVKITSGTGVNQERLVWRNTTATLIVKPNWTTTPSSTSTYAVGNPFRHRIDQFSGQHMSDEAVRSPGTATTFGWFTAIGTKLHVACADCHNPHSQRKPGAAQGKTTAATTYNTISTIEDNGLVGGTKSWTPNMWKGFMLAVIDRSLGGEERMIISNTTNRLRVGATFSSRLTGIYYNIIPRGRAEIAPTYNGNSLNGPNNGQWGVKVVKWDKPLATTVNFDNLSSPTFSKITTLKSMAYPNPNRVYELCFKCHSKYGWGTSGTPFRIMDGGFRAMGTYSTGRSKDIAALANPNNLAHHALVARGNNQPIRENYTGVPGFRSITSYYNIGGSYSRWPKWAPTGSSSTLRIDTTGKARVTAASGGLPNTVIPGWFVFVGSNNPPAKQQGTTGNGRKGYLQIKEITNYTSFQVNTPPGVAVNNITSFAISAGLGNAFVPPYGPWSVIGCADCHDTDGSADPSGPHGSGRNWLLRKMEKQKFPWMNSSGYIRTIGWGVDNGWTGTYAANTLCLNCHRADVYGNDGANQSPNGGGAAPTGAEFMGFKWRGQISRQLHDPDGASGSADAFQASVNTFRIACMNCHGGGVSGQIHGTNMGAAVGGESYRGKRFLTGGAWTGVVRGTTAVGLSCTEGPAAEVAAAINSCGGSGTNTGLLVSNYDYDGGAD